MVTVPSGIGEYFSGVAGIGGYSSDAPLLTEQSEELVELLAVARGLCPEAIVQTVPGQAVFVVWRRVGLGWWCRGLGGISGFEPIFLRGEGGSSTCNDAFLCRGVREGHVHPAEDAVGLLVLRAQSREPDSARCRYCLQPFNAQMPGGNIGCLGGLYCGECVEFAECEIRERRGVERCLFSGSTIDAEPDDAPEQAPPENVWGIPRKRVTIEPVPMSDTRRMADRNGGVPVHTPLDRRIAVAQMIVEARHPRRAPWDWEPEE